MTTAITTEGARYFERGHVAKELDVSGEYVRKLTRQLPYPVARTSGGTHLYTRADVEELKRLREQGRRAEADAV
jgi:hypothetical protein